MAVDNLLHTLTASPMEDIDIHTQANGLTNSTIPT
jgi:hypothetical protein